MTGWLTEAESEQDDHATFNYDKYLPSHLPEATHTCDDVDGGDDTRVRREESGWSGQGCSLPPHSHLTPPLCLIIS